MSEINFVDVSLRDGHQSLWATRMTTAMMLPIASLMDGAGFKVVELMGTVHFDACVRYLREDPWERIRIMVKAMPKTPLAGAVRSKSLISFDLVPDSVIALWIKRMAANGLRRVIVYDALHDWRNITKSVRIAKAEGLEVQTPLVFSLSPVHTDEYYAGKAAELAKLNVDSVYIKDSIGLLTPDRVKTLVPAVQQNLGGLPLEIHSHCTTGLASLCYLEAIKLGITTVHTAVSPLANGPSLPSAENIIMNTRRLGHTPNIDEKAVEVISRHFRYVAKRENKPLGEPVEYDAFQYEHQLPGGMITNFKFMLSQRGMEHQLDQVLEETALVRKELGYPVMITPFSQIVATQAALNVVLGERYKEVPDEVIKYVLEFYGKPPTPVDQNVLDKITSSPRAKEFLDWEPPQPSIRELRRELGAKLSDDELVLRALFPEEHVNATIASSPIKTDYPSPAVEKPVVALVRELTRKSNLAYLHIQKGDFSLTLGKSASEKPSDA